MPSSPSSLSTRRRGLRARLRWVVLALVLALTCGSTTGCSAQAPSGQPAVDSLVGYYDQRTGVWFTTGWWNSANALTALIDHMLQTGDERYLWVVENTYEKKVSAAYGNFTNYLIDDTGWWALAWIRAYDLTGDQRYLRTAQAGVDFMWRYHDDECGGGLWWSTSRQYKAAVANELFVKAAAELDLRLGGGTEYLTQAISVWEWFEASGMINGELLINDGLTPVTCVNNLDAAWTYNQGVVLGALVALDEATGDEAYLDRARELADASTTADYLHDDDGVLTEVCEASGCGIDGPSFKGIYVRNLGELNRALEDRPYQDYLVEQATIVYEQNRADGDRYGLHWAGPVDYVNGATQASVVDLFTAAQPPAEEPEPSPSPISTPRLPPAPSTSPTLPPAPSTSSTVSPAPSTSR